MRESSARRARFAHLQNEDGAAGRPPPPLLCAALPPAGVQRSSTHLSLLALYALGGHLVNAGLLPVGVLVTAIGFTFSLVFATQARRWGWCCGGPAAGCCLPCSLALPSAAVGWPAGPASARRQTASPPRFPHPAQGMLQTFADLRGMLASVRRVRATLSELPPDDSMVATLAPLPDEPWVDPAASRDGSTGSGAHPSHPGLPDEGPATAAGSLGGSEDEEGGCGRAVEAAQQGDLRLQGVSFSYPTRPGAAVLRDLSLNLPRGKVTAVVGRCAAGAWGDAGWGGGRGQGGAAAGECLAATSMDCAPQRQLAVHVPRDGHALPPCPATLRPRPGRSGAGKSTVAALLERLYTPDAGAITLGGQVGWCAASAVLP